MKDCSDGGMRNDGSSHDSVCGAIDEVIHNDES